ncbi:MAG TPA: hypothetical protein VF867_11910 [Arthrobacter sp.]
MAEQSTKPLPADDPRIPLLLEQDRRLLMIGKSTMGMMLAAADAAGLIPASRTEVHYGVETTPGFGVAICQSSERAVALTEALNNDHDGYTFAVVTRAHTTFDDRITDWVPLAPEETHV